VGSLTADDASAVTGWLDDNGFVIPCERQSLLDAYVAPGRYFIAITRNEASRRPIPNTSPTAGSLRRHRSARRSTTAAPSRA
jgi:hypothetical protein